MKFTKFVFAAVLSLGLVACQEEAATSSNESETAASATPAASVAPAAEAAPADAAGFTTAAWDSKVHDFGTIPQGVPVTHTFKVTNTGSEPLTITNVKASCGCTATEYTREAIPPGGEGIVQARYNAAAEGNFNKSVTVTYNTENQRELLRLTGIVQTAN